MKTVAIIYEKLEDVKNEKKKNTDKNIKSNK